MLSLIVAISQNRVIGRDNAMPWHLPDDLKYFRRVTKGNPVIMGRKTHESIGRPLPQRQNIVVSRDPNYHTVGCSVVGSLEAALATAEPGKEAFIIGGAALYRQSLSMVDRVYLTEVRATVEGDTFFPELGNQWQEVSRQPHLADSEHVFAFDWVVLEQVSKS